MLTMLKRIEKNSLKTLLQQYSHCFNIPVYLLDSNKSVLLQFPEAIPLSAHVAKPLFCHASTIGYVAVPTENAPDGCIDFLCQNLSYIAERHYELESLSGEVAKNYEELFLVRRLSSRLSAAGLDVSGICSVLAEGVMNICPSNNVSVLLAVENDIATGAFFRPGASFGTASREVMTMRFSASDGPLGRVYSKKEPLTFHNESTDRIEGLPFPVGHIMIVPLIVEGSVTGVVMATDKLDGDEYYSTEIKLVSSIASEFALSIRKALLFEEIRNILVSISESYASAIEAKDPYTLGHSRRVAEISTTIAGAMGFSTDDTNRIKLAALLHDVGKIGTPESILHKSSKLSDEEWEVMKEHPGKGADMIGLIGRLREIAEWIRHHHERRDGMGYPLGVTTEKIPVPSKIIAIADCYDALTSERPYRKALSKQEALAIMRENIGTQFDPDVFEHFLKAI